MRLRQINEVINKQEKEKIQRAILDHVVRMPAYFYFRHRSYVDTLPAHDRHKYLSEGPEESSKLDKLKKEIKFSKFNTTEYSDPKEIATTSPDKALIMNSLARLYETQAQFDLAEVILRKSLEINEAVDGKLSQNTSNTLTRLGAVLVHTGKLDEADELLRQSLKIREDGLGKNHSRVGQTLKHLLTVCQMQGDYKGAEEYGLRALRITEEACGPYDYHVSSILLKGGVGTVETKTTLESSRVAPTDLRAKRLVKLVPLVDTKRLIGALFTVYHVIPEKKGCGLLLQGSDQNSCVYAKFTMTSETLASVGPNPAKLQFQDIRVQSKDLVFPTKDKKDEFSMEILELHAEGPAPDLKRPHVMVYPGAKIAGKIQKIKPPLFQQYLNIEDFKTWYEGTDEAVSNRLREALLSMQNTESSTNMTPPLIPPQTQQQTDPPILPSPVPILEEKHYANTMPEVPHLSTIGLHEDSTGGQEQLEMDLSELQVQTQGHVQVQENEWLRQKIEQTEKKGRDKLKQLEEQNRHLEKEKMELKIQLNQEKENLQKQLMDLLGSSLLTTVATKVSQTVGFATPLGALPPTEKSEVKELQSTVSRLQKELESTKKRYQEEIKKLKIQLREAKKESSPRSPLLSPDVQCGSL